MLSRIISTRLKRKVTERMVRRPLSLALSPSDGAREKNSRNAKVHSAIDACHDLHSLPPSDGERARERGLCN